MRLKQLIEAIGIDHEHLKLKDFEVSGISCDSKDVKDNFIFVAIKGVNDDGHRFISEAVENGAKAIIVGGSGVRAQGSSNASFVIAHDTRKALAKLAARFYGNPSAKIKVIGITGTNGKTTVSYLLEAMLKEAGLEPAVIGTVNYRFKNRIIPAKNTTPGPIELESMFAQMVKERVAYAVMEVSSHALDQNRVEGINFHSAVFTNLTQDHLDYHHTIEAYFQAKSQLFKNINFRSFAIINDDDEYGRRLKGLTPAKIVTYAINSPAEIVAQDIKFYLTHTEFCLRAKNMKANLKTSLIGRHNIYNILAAAAVALTEGIELRAIKTTLERFFFVPGRLEKIDAQGGFSVFVDYAHTPDALANAIGALRQLSKNRIIVVFGCGGERDKTKRPKMGEIVSELADFAIITNDNPRRENPQDILNGIKQGIKKDNYTVIPDRFAAIRESLHLAKPGDIVLIAGKGHEDYQILKDKRVHFDDREVVWECLKSMNY